MDFEKLKDAWPRREFARHLFDRPSPGIAVRIRKNTEEKDRKIFPRDIRETVTRALVIVMLVMFLEPGRSRLALARVVITTAGIAFVLAMFHATRIRHRAKRMDLPMKDFCRTELDKIEAHITLQKRYSSWYAVPLALGLGLYAISIIPSLVETLLWLLGILTLAAVFHLHNKMKIKKDLFPLKEELERQLRDFEGNGV